MVERLQKDFATVLAEPSVQEGFDTLGMDTGGNTPEEFTQQIQSDLARWSDVVKKGKIKIE